MTLSLSGLGTAVPKHRFTQAELAELHGSFLGLDEKRARTVRALYRRSGVKTRGSVVLEGAEGPLERRQSFYHRAASDSDPGPTTAQRMRVFSDAAPPLAVAASRRALECAGIPARSVTHLVTVSCTGFVAPGVESALAAALGLPRATERTHVGWMGCHGALNALRVADSIVRADPSRVPLVCSVELCTLHFAYGWNPAMAVANALFADGAAAVAGTFANGQEDGWRLSGTGTFLVPDSHEDMTWRIGDHGFRMTLSAKVPGLIATHLGSWMEEWLGARGLTIADVPSWAVHPGGPRILCAVEDALGIPSACFDASREVLAEYGNMSSATILFILDRLIQRRAPTPCVALAFGPGLVVEALLLE